MGYFLKACPRCRGDLVEDSDIYGEYVHCIQCGYQKDTAVKGEKKDPPETPAFINLEKGPHRTFTKERKEYPRK